MGTIFNKLKGGMEQVVSGAQEKIHEAQLRAQLRAIEREKADQIAALGSTVYAMHCAGEIHLETLHGPLQAIEATGQRIAEKQQEIDAFVATVGATAPAGSPGTTAPVDRHCTGCGAILSPAAKFCPECGAANMVEPV